MWITEQEIVELKKFIFELNSIKNSAVVVEGKRDAAALERIGYEGEILKFHYFQGMIEFTDFASRYKSLIVLFDRDRKGRHFTRTMIKLLNRRTKIDTSYKRKLQKITKGKIMFTEQLICYEAFLV